jgi:hypothetical protein
MPFRSLLRAALLSLVGLAALDVETAEALSRPVPQPSRAEALVLVADKRIVSWWAEAPTMADASMAR